MLKSMPRRYITASDSGCATSDGSITMSAPDHRDVRRVAEQEHHHQDEDQVHPVGPLHLLVHRGEDADQAAGEPVLHVRRLGLVRGDVLFARSMDDRIVSWV